MTPEEQLILRRNAIFRACADLEFPLRGYWQLSETDYATLRLWCHVCDPHGGPSRRNVARPLTDYAMTRTENDLALTCGHVAYPVPAVVLVHADLVLFFELDRLR